MQTNISIDMDMIQKAMLVSGMQEQDEVMRKAVELFIQFHSQQKLRELRGKVFWEGNLDDMRMTRNDNLQFR